MFHLLNDRYLRRTSVTEVGKKPFLPQKTCLKPLSGIIASGLLVFN